MLIHIVKDLMNRQLKTTEDDEIDALIAKANNAGIICTREMIEGIRRRFEKPILTKEKLKHLESQLPKRKKGIFYSLVAFFRRMIIK